MKFLRFFYKLIPFFIKCFIDHYLRLFKNSLILAYKYGQLRSIKEKSAVDFVGNPIPWYTYPAIEYLSHLDFSELNIFEFGSGNSTLWWAKKAKMITSVEDNEEWYNKTLKHPQFCQQKINYLLAKNQKNYIDSLIPSNFDIVIIDGKFRPECASQTIKIFEEKAGIMIVFDNSDWYPETIANLKKELNWLQIDFHGFSPINCYTLTTSLFINPNRCTQLKYIKNLKSKAAINIK